MEKPGEHGASIGLVLSNKACLWILYYYMINGELQLAPHFDFRLQRNRIVQRYPLLSAEPHCSYYRPQWQSCCHLVCFTASTIVTYVLRCFHFPCSWRHRHRHYFPLPSTCRYISGRGYSDHGQHQPEFRVLLHTSKHLLRSSYKTACYSLSVPDFYAYAPDSPTVVEWRRQTVCFSGQNDSKRSSCLDKL